MPENKKAIFRDKLAVTAVGIGIVLVFLLVFQGPLEKIFSAQFDYAKTVFVLEMARLNTGFLLLLVLLAWFAKRFLHLRNFDSETRFFSALLVMVLLVSVGLVFVSNLSPKFWYLEKTRGLKWHDYVIQPLQLERDLLIQMINASQPGEMDLHNSRIPVYQLFVRKMHLDELNANLPFSGSENVAGNLQIGKTVFPAKVRYRGDNYYHWGAVNKSWRIKLKDDVLLEGINKFNLINPKYDDQMTFTITSTISSAAGILSPRAFPVALFINNEYAGLYEYADQLDESFLRLNNLLPGDIYSGDKPRDENEWITPELQNAVISDNPLLWEVSTTFDGEDERAQKNIVLLLEKTNSEDPTVFIEFFSQHLGEEYLRFLAEKTLIGDIHVDDRHNHRFYFDPSSGKFVPMAWDQQIEPLDPDSTPDLVSNWIDRQVVRFPQLVGMKNQLMQEQLTAMDEEKIVSLIDETAAKIEAPLLYDFHRDVADWPLSRNITMQEWKNGVQKLKDVLRANYGFVRGSLDETRARLTVLDNNILVLDVNGVSGVRLESGSESCLLVRRHALEGNAFCLGEEGTETVFFPGRKISTKTVRLGRLDANQQAVEPETIRYVFDADTPVTQETLTKMRFYNATNGKRVFPELVFGDTVDIEQYLEPGFSFHPWLFLPPEPDETVWSGNVLLESDAFFPENHSLRIEPGTNIRLQKGVSIISFGKIVFAGTEENPITVSSEGLDPWGAIAVQGKKAELEMDWTRVSNGSGAFFREVQYTGMLSVYNAQKLTIRHSVFSDNQLTDDMVNFKRTPVFVSDSDFLNAKSDALDMDIVSEGEVISSRFSVSGGDAIDMMTTDVIIRDVAISGSGDKGISIGEKSNPFISDVRISDSNIGIAIKDRSNPQISRITIESSSNGIEAYPKNWRYGGGGLGTVSDFSICNNQQPLQIQPDSNVLFVRGGQKIFCTDASCDIGCGT